jgi:hypothetical protein
MATCEKFPFETASYATNDEDSIDDDDEFFDPFAFGGASVRHTHRRLLPHRRQVSVSEAQLGLEVSLSMQAVFMKDIMLVNVCCGPCQYTYGFQLPHFLLSCAGSTFRSNRIILVAATVDLLLLFLSQLHSFCLPCSQESG